MVWVRIVELFPFVVAQGHAAIVMVDNIVRINRDLTATARTIDNVLRDSVAAGVAAEAFDDFNALGDTGAQMSGAFDEVALVEVIRTDPAHQ